MDPSKTEIDPRRVTRDHLTRWLEAHDARCIREEPTHKPNGNGRLVKDGGRLSFYSVKGNLLVVQDYPTTGRGFNLLVAPSDTGRLDYDLDTLALRWDKHGVQGYHAGDEDGGADYILNQCSPLTTAALIADPVYQRAAEIAHEKKFPAFKTVQAHRDYVEVLARTKLCGECEDPIGYEAFVLKDYLDQDEIGARMTETDFLLKGTDGRWKNAEHLRCTDKADEHGGEVFMSIAEQMQQIEADGGQHGS